VSDGHPHGEGDRASFQPPEGLLNVAGKLEASGHEAWAVGGAIRDAIRGLPRADWDLATDARPDQVRRLFPKTVPLGVEHGTVGVVSEDGTMFEVTTFRLDVETDGRHAVVEFATDVEDDLARRDFTINAIAWRPATDDVRDPYGGRHDLRDGILRAVGEPDVRFAEDYLRVLRAFRFAGAYDLSIEPATASSLRLAVPRLDRLSAERVREELLKVMSCPEPSKALRMYASYGAFESWYPEIARVAHGAPWDAALAAIDAIGAHRTFLRVVRFLLCAEGGDASREAAAHALLTRLKFSNADIRRGVHLVSHYTPLVHPADSSASIREWLHEAGPESARDLFRLHFAAARAGRSEDGVRALTFTWRRVHDELVGGSPVSMAQLAIDGTDLLELGLPRGPLIGLMLEELLAQVIESPESNERETLLRSARELIELGGLDALEGGAKG
jgi:tRNA nucleotidyltransferase (CCA-adding enzyme)